MSYVVMEVVISSKVALETILSMVETVLMPFLAKMVMIPFTEALITTLYMETMKSLLALCLGTTDYLAVMVMTPFLVVKETILYMEVQATISFSEKLEMILSTVKRVMIKLTLVTDGIQSSEETVAI